MGKIVIMITLVASLAAITTTVVGLGIVFNQLGLMDAQIQDVKHENIITRINNARGILMNCDMDDKEKLQIDKILYDASRKATLLKDFDGAEKILDQHVEFLATCELLYKKNMPGIESERLPSAMPLEEMYPLEEPFTPAPELSGEESNSTESKP